MMLLVMALLIGGHEKVRPVEIGPSPAASEVLAPMTKKVGEDETGDNELEWRKRVSSMATLASIWFAELARFAMDADETELENIRVTANASVEAIQVRFIFDGMTEARFARLRLLELLELVTTELDFALSLAAVDELGPEPALVVARALFADTFPDCAAKLTDDDLRLAIEIWNKRGAPRRTTKTPKKWAHLATMFGRIGLGGATPAALEADWRQWRAQNGGFESPAVFRRRIRREDLMEAVMRQIRERAISGL